MVDFFCRPIPPNPTVHTRDSFKIRTKLRINPTQELIVYEGVKLHTKSFTRLLMNNLTTAALTPNTLFGLWIYEACSKGKKMIGK